MKAFSQAFTRLATGFEHYGNPYQMLVQRVLGNSLKLFDVKDRASRVACWCTPGSHRMFSEIWFYKAYDVPGVNLRPGDLVLDIGANQGFYSCYAAYQGARVIAFEPDTESYATLTRNLKRNGFTDRVIARCQAVGRETGQIDFYTTPMLGGGMNTTSAEFATYFHHAKSRKVDCVKFSDILGAIPDERVRLCKLDCEGAELDILGSLDISHAERIDAFALEYHPQAYPVDRIIECMLAWETHEVMFAPSKGAAPVSVIYALSKSVLRDIARTIKG
jgi:FkbM family methyltransferase